MKILYDHDIFYIQKVGGVSKYFLEIFSIIKKFHNVKIVAPIYINEYLKDYKSKNIFKLLKIKKKYKYTNRFFRFLNIIIFKFFLNIYKPNIIHLTYFNKKLEFKKNCKIVITVYDLIHEIYQKKYFFKYPSNFKKEYISNADHIICISKNTKKDLLKFYNVDKKKISVISLGFNRSKKFIKINDSFLNNSYLLFVGERKKYKNFINLIIAYSNSKKLMSNFKIVCFGGGPLDSLEKKLFKKYNINLLNVKCISGSNEELNYVYMKAKAYICTSLYEGFGMTILEAMNMNCPIISSNAGSLKEVGGDAVEYFDPNNIQDIKSKIEKIVFSKKNIYSQIKKYHTNLEKFSWELTAKKTISVYEKLYNK